MDENDSIPLSSNLKPDRSQKKKKIIIISISFILVLIAGAIFYYFYIYQNSKSQITNSNIDETEDWLNFENKLYGYSIKYPKDWQVNEKDLADVKFTQKGNQDATLGNNLNALVEIISSSLDDANLRSEDWAKNYLSKENYSLNEALIGGKQAILANITTLNVTNSDVQIQYGFLIADEIKYIFKQVDSTKSAYDNFNKMIRSFKLIARENNNASSSNLATEILPQTYTNEEFGISIKYPKDWFTNDLGNEGNSFILSQIGFSENNTDKVLFCLKITNRNIDEEIASYKAGFASSEIKTEQDTSIDGYNGKKIISYKDGIEKTAIFINKNGKIYMLIGESKNDNSSYQLYYDQMVESIKFI